MYISFLFYLFFRGCSCRPSMNAALDGCLYEKLPLPEWSPGNSSTVMWGILIVTQDIYSDSTWGTYHYHLFVLIRNRTIRAHVVVIILNAPSWLSSILCYHGYKPAQQAPPLWEGLRRQQRGRRTDLGAVISRCDVWMFTSLLHSAQMFLFPWLDVVMLPSTCLNRPTSTRVRTCFWTKATDSWLNSLFNTV